MKIYLDNCCIKRSGIGVVWLIRFMQHFDKGQGDYTADRQEWQKEYSVDSLLKAMQSERRE
jgi:hypothetical protein